MQISIAATCIIFISVVLCDLFYAKSRPPAWLNQATMIAAFMQVLFGLSALIAAGAYLIPSKRSSVGPLHVLSRFIAASAIVGVSTCSLIPRQIATLSLWLGDKAEFANPELSITMYKIGTSLDTSEAFPLSKLAEKQASLDKFADAIRTISTKIELHHQESEIESRFRRVEFNIEAGNFSEALKEIDQLNRLDTYGWRTLARAKYHAAQGAHREAIQELLEVDDRSGIDSELRQYLAGSHYALGDYDQSLKYLKPLSEDTYANLYLARGIMLEDMGKNSHAKAEFEHAIEKNSRAIESNNRYTQPEMYLVSAYAYQRLGNPAKSKALLAVAKEYGLTRDKLLEHLFLEYSGIKLRW